MVMITTFVAWAVIDSGGVLLGRLRSSRCCPAWCSARSSNGIIIRPIENAPPLNAVIVTLGLLALLQALAGMIWGSNPQSFPPAFSIKGYEVGGHTLLFSPSTSSACSSSPR